MGKITEAQVEMAYLVSKQVFAGKTKRGDGATLLATEYKLNKASAGDFINCFKCMTEGRLFQRAMSHKAMDYFLTNITKDFSRKILENSLNALEKHIDYWEEQYSTNAISMRKVLNKHRTIQSGNTTMELVFEQFNSDVDRSLTLSSVQRAHYINFGDSKPKQMVVSAKIYQRNPHVVAERLTIANGVCERCKMKAPFFRAKDGTPYLEVHHIERLSEGGVDILENTVALCPNCHRELHFG
ncbi:TPA: HNH endonuclease [Vibrio parahaemolyticus]